MWDNFSHIFLDNRIVFGILPAVVSTKIFWINNAQQMDWPPRGSPPPSWRRPSIDEMLQGGSNRPSVCVSLCADRQDEAGQNNNLKSALGPTKYAPLDPIKKKTVQ
jgi:hypothetical protein